MHAIIELNEINQLQWIISTNYIWPHLSEVKKRCKQLTEIGECLLGCAINMQLV